MKHIGEMKVVYM